LFHIKLFTESTENTEVILPGSALGVKFVYDVPGVIPNWVAPLLIFAKS
jgi:hypothetical protein